MVAIKYTKSTFPPIAQERGGIKERVPVKLHRTSCRSPLAPKVQSRFTSSVLVALPWSKPTSSPPAHASDIAKEGWHRAGAGAGAASSTVQMLRSTTMGEDGGEPDHVAARNHSRPEGLKNKNGAQLSFHGGRKIIFTCSPHPGCT